MDKAAAKSAPREEGGGLMEVRGGLMAFVQLHLTRRGAHDGPKDGVGGERLD